MPGIIRKNTGAADAALLDKRRMTTAQDLIANLEKINIGHLAEECIEETKEAFAKLNTEQMYEGKTNTGNDIVPEYASSTKVIKKRKGQPFDRVTLRDKGAFHDQYSLDVDGGNIIMGSDVEYEQYLDKKYKEIYGLDADKNTQYVQNDFFPVFKEKFQEQTNLQMQ